MLEIIAALLGSHLRGLAGAFPLLAGVGALALPLCAACGEAPAAGGPAETSPARLSRFVFGTLPDGRDVTAATLRNRNGLEIEVIAYGAILRAVRVPDRAGSLADITLGFDDLAGYLGDSPYFGAVVGRYANRIAEGRFELGGVRHELSRNDGPNHLHVGRGAGLRLVHPGGTVDARSLAVVDELEEQGRPVPGHRQVADLVHHR